MEDKPIVPETENLNSQVLCRVCLAEQPQDEEENKFLSVFDHFGNHSIADLINEQLVEQIIILEDDSHTKKVCRQCAQDVVKACDTKNRCLKSDQTLRDIISQQSIKIEMIQCEPEIKLENILSDEQIDVISLDYPSLQPKLENNVLDKVEHRSALKVKRGTKTKTPNRTNESTSVLSKPYIDNTPDRHYCCKCTDIFTNEGVLMDHFLQNHFDSIDATIELQPMNKNTHQCPLCRALFTKRSAVSKHKRRKYSNSNLHAVSFPCKICLRVHSRRHYAEKCEQIHNGTLQKIPCPREGCSAVLKTNDTLKSHLELHDFPNVARFTCDICGHKSRKLCHFKKHAGTHTDEKNYECHLCGKKLKTKSTIESHLRIHTNAGARPFQCEICPKSYMYPRDLKHHLLIHTLMQTGVRPFKCQFLECGKAFFKRKHLKQHEKTHDKIATHNLQLQHKCQFSGCTKGFATRSKLQRHETIHQKKIKSVHHQGVANISTSKELAGNHASAMISQPFVNDNFKQEVMSYQELTCKKESA